MLGIHRSRKMEVLQLGTEGISNLFLLSQMCNLHCKEYTNIFPLDISKYEGNILSKKLKFRHVRMV